MFKMGATITLLQYCRRVLCSSCCYCILQIDGTSPTLNLTINQALLDTGIVALQLGKSDLGSGVASVDVYELIGT